MRKGNSLRPERKRRKRYLVLLLGAFFLLTTRPLLATPFFSREHRVPCNFCHAGFPKLNPQGERFKERGLRLEERPFQATEWLKTIPVTMRSTLDHTRVDHHEATTTGFLKIASAASVGPRLAYWVDHAWTSEGRGVERLGIDNAWVRFDFLPGRLYARGGRMELDLPVSQARRPTLLPYAILFENTGFESDNLGGNQDGVELGGFFQEDTHWSVAVVRGQNSPLAELLSKEAAQFDGNVYARTARRFGSHRIGSFFYVGRNKLARTDKDTVLVWENRLRRFGADGSVWLGRANLYGLFLHGRNDNSIADAAHPSGTRQPLSFTGGFFQADYLVIDHFATSLRVDVVRRPSGDPAVTSPTYYGVFPGLQVFLGDQLRLAAELGLLNQDRPTVATAQIRFVF